MTADQQTLRATVAWFDFRTRGTLPRAGRTLARIAMMKSLRGFSAGAAFRHSLSVNSMGVQAQRHKTLCPQVRPQECPAASEPDRNSANVERVLPQ